MLACRRHGEADPSQPAAGGHFGRPARDRRRRNGGRTAAAASLRRVLDARTSGHNRPRNHPQGHRALGTGIEPPGPGCLDGGGGPRPAGRCPGPRGWSAQVAGYRGNGGARHLRPRVDSVESPWSSPVLGCGAMAALGSRVERRDGTRPSPSPIGPSPGGGRVVREGACMAPAVSAVGAGPSLVVLLRKATARQPHRAGSTNRAPTLKPSPGTSPSTQSTASRVPARFDHPGSGRHYAEASASEFPGPVSSRHLHRRSTPALVCHPTCPWLVMAATACRLSPHGGSAARLAGDHYGRPRRAYATLAPHWPRQRPAAATSPPCVDFRGQPACRDPSEMLGPSLQRTFRRLQQAHRSPPDLWSRGPGPVLLPRAFRETADRIPERSACTTKGSQQA